MGTQRSPAMAAVSAHVFLSPRALALGQDEPRIVVDSRPDSYFGRLFILSDEKLSPSAEETQ